MPFRVLDYGHHQRRAKWPLDQSRAGDLVGSLVSNPGAVPILTWVLEVEVAWAVLVHLEMELVIWFC